MQNGTVPKQTTACRNPIFILFLGFALRITCFVVAAGFFFGAAFWIGIVLYHGLIAPIISQPLDIPAIIGGAICAPLSFLIGNLVLRINQIRAPVPGQNNIED